LNLSHLVETIVPAWIPAVPKDHYGKFLGPLGGQNVHNAASRNQNLSRELREWAAHSRHSRNSRQKNLRKNPKKPAISSTKWSNFAKPKQTRAKARENTAPLQDRAVVMVLAHRLAMTSEIQEKNFRFKIATSGYE